MATPRLTALQVERQWFVAHHAERYHGVHFVGYQREAAVHVGGGANGGAVETNLHKGQWLTGEGVGYLAVKAGAALLCQACGGAQGQAQSKQSQYQPAPLHRLIAQSWLSGRSR